MTFLPLKSRKSSPFWEPLSATSQPTRSRFGPFMLEMSMALVLSPEAEASSAAMAERGRGAPGGPEGGGSVVEVGGGGTATAACWTFDLECARGGCGGGSAWCAGRGRGFGSALFVAASEFVLRGVDFAVHDVGCGHDLLLDFTHGIGADDALGAGLRGGDARAKHPSKHVDDEVHTRFLRDASGRASPCTVLTGNLGECMRTETMRKKLWVFKRERGERDVDCCVGRRVWVTLL